MDDAQRHLTSAVQAAFEFEKAIGLLAYASGWPPELAQERAIQYARRWPITVIDAAWELWDRTAQGETWESIVAGEVNR